MSNSTARRRRSQTPKRGRLLSLPSIADQTLTNSTIRPFYPTPEGGIPDPTSRRKNSFARRAVAPAPRGIVRLADARHKYRASLHVPGKAEKDTGAEVLRRTLPETERFERPVLLARPSRRGRSQLLSGSTRAPNVRGIVRGVREEPAIAATSRPSDPVTADLGGGRKAGWDMHHARGRRAPAISGLAPSRVRR